MLRKLLGHQYLNTTQLYARIYEETLYEQFKTAMSRLEAIAVDDWPGVDIGVPMLTENRRVGLPTASVSRIRYDLAK
jgi:hypothetical protein